MIQEDSHRQWRLTAWRRSPHSFVIMLTSVFTHETFVWSFDTLYGCAELDPALRVADLPNYYACGQKVLPPRLRALLRAFCTADANDRRAITTELRSPRFVTDCKRWIANATVCSVAGCDQHTEVQHKNCEVHPAGCHRTVTSFQRKTLH